MDALVAVAIHDAKNGLTSLNTWLEEAQREHPSAAITEAQAVATRIGAQLVELLALYRENEGSLRLAIDDHYLSDFCSDLFAELSIPPGSAIELRTETAAADEIGTWAFDAYQVKMVLLDALRNAARHANHWIQFGIRQTDEGLCFSVSDDGPGFPDELLAGGETTMASGGSGLGLSFAHLIARRHATPNGRQGRIEMHNDNGAVFRLHLP
jgi:signal transduction histidine kinase